MWWDVKRSLSMPIFLVHNIFIMLAGYEGVHLSSVAVEVTLEKTPTPSKEEHLQSITQLLVDIALHENRYDIRIWGGEATGAYTVKSGSELIDNISYPGNFPHSFLLWKGFSPPEIKMFIWLLLQGRVCTRAFLVHHHLIHSCQVMCLFCGHETEHDNHLFLHCYHMWRLWQQFHNWFSISGCMLNRIDQIISQWQDMAKGKF
jgi:hypothetical protein